MIIFFWVCLFLCAWMIIGHSLDGNLGVAMLFFIMAIPIIFAISLDSDDDSSECKEKGGIYIKIENQYKCARKIEFIVNEEK